MSAFEPNSRSPSRSPLSRAELSLIGITQQDEPHKRTAEFEENEGSQALVPPNAKEDLTSRSQEEAQKQMV